MFKLCKVWLIVGILIPLLGAFLTVESTLAEPIKPSGLTGVVVDKDSSVGVSVTKVRLFKSNSEYSTMTGSGGIFSLTVPRGYYKVEVTHPAYQTLYSGIQIIAGEFSEVSWSLARKANLDLGWYSGTGPAERDKYRTFSEEVNTVILYTKQGECDNADIQEALKAMPDRIGVWLELPYKFHIEAYHDCRTKGGFAVTPDKICELKFNRDPDSNTPQYCAETYLKPLAEGMERILNFEGANKILGWYLFDEPYYPELWPDTSPPAGYRDTGWSAQTLREVADFIRQNYREGKPTLPFLGVINREYNLYPNLGTIQDWAAVTQYLGLDYYPKREPESNFAYVNDKWERVKPCDPHLEPFVPVDLYYFNESQTKLKTVVGHKGGAGSYHITQGQGCKTNCGLLTPTLTEVRWEAWTGLLRGVGGILYYWYPYSDEDIGRDQNSIRTSVHQVFREIRELNIRAILYEGQASQAYEHNADPDKLDVAYRYYNGRWYLAVVNGPDQSRYVTFKLNASQLPGNQGKMVTELIFNDQIELQKQASTVVFSDNLPKGAVRFYRLFDPPPKPGENLGFEEGLNLWKAYGDGIVEVTATDSFSGSHSARIQRLKGTGNYFGLYQEGIVVKPDTEYRLSLRVKTKATQGCAAAALGVWSDDSSRNHHSDLGHLQETSSGWVHISGTWKSRPDEKVISVALYGSRDFVGEAYFDSLVLEEVQPKNLGFEEGLQYWESYGDGTTYGVIGGGVEGLYSAHLRRDVATNNYFGLKQKKIPCEPNTTYRLTLWVKIDAGKSGCAAAAMGNWGSPNTHKEIEWRVGDAGVTDWTQKSVTWTSQGDETSMDIVLYGSEDFSGKTYFDGVVLEKIGNIPSSQRLK